MTDRTDAVPTEPITAETTVSAAPKRATKGTYKACIDRLTIVICTAAPTKPAHIFSIISEDHPVLARVVPLPSTSELASADADLFVDPSSAKLWNRTTDRFRLEIVDLQRSHQLAALLDAINRRTPLAAPAQPETIEVSLDYYLTGASKTDLAARVADLARFAKAASQRDWYLYRNQGETVPTAVGVIELRELIALLADGYQAANADHDARPREHAYVKTTDDGGKAALPPSAWRARFESRINCADVGCHTLDDLLGINFAQVFADRFKWQRPRAIGAIKAVTDAKVTNWAKPGKYQSPSGSGKAVKYSPALQAHKELNKTASRKLGDLTTAWRSSFPPRRTGAI